MSNPTSNFGWQMPTPTDLVTDLPADFEVFGQAVDTSLADLRGGTTGQVLKKNTNTDMDFVWGTDTAGMTNPMTTTGDTIYSSSGSTPARLGIGSTGQILTVASGIPTWATPTAVGRTLLSTTTLSGATTTVSSISQDYAELYIEIANLNPSANSNFRIAPNSVTNLGYTVAMSGGGVTTHEQGYWKINQVWNMTSGNTNNITTMYIHNYTSSTEFKTAESNCLFQAQNQTGLRIIYSAHGFESTTAISSLQFSNDSGNQNGGTVRIYGVK